MDYLMTEDITPFNKEIFAFVQESQKYSFQKHVLMEINGHQEMREV